MLWVQAAIGALLVPAVARVGSVAFGRRAGLVAAAGAAIYPDLVWFSTRFWSETLFIVLLWWAIERTLAADLSGSRRTAAVAGVLWALATLTRELALYLVPLAALWMLRPRAWTPAGEWRTRLRPARARLALAALVLSSLLAIGPWTIRNAIVFRAFIPVSTMGGLNLWQGNTTLTHLQIYEVLARIEGPVAQDRYCRQLAWQTIAARQPGWILEKLAEQMPEFWKAGSEVLDHLVGREACGPLATGRSCRSSCCWSCRTSRSSACWRGARPTAIRGGSRPAAAAARRVQRRPRRGLRDSSLPPARDARRVPRGRCRAPGRAEGSLLPLRGRRAVLVVLLLLVAVALIAPGLEELASWRLLTGHG